METFSLDSYTEGEILFFTAKLACAEYFLCYVEQLHEDQLVHSFLSGDYS